MTDSVIITPQGVGAKSATMPNIDQAYVEPDNRVLDPSTISASLIDRMPSPTGWRMLVLPYRGKAMTSGGIAITKSTLDENQIQTVVGYVLKQGPLAYGDKDKFPEGAWCKEKDWVVFPWEHSDVAEEGIEANVTRILQHISEDPERGGLIETPTRVNKAWQEWASGYGKNPADVLKTFEDGGEDYDEMVVVNNIPVYSKCEHHLADIIGSATVGYIPNGKVVGLSKLSRLVNIFARRLQVQERLTVQVTGALMEHLSPLGAGCIINARHMCMESRGICQRGTITTTSSLCGVMRDDPAVRAEFIELAKNQAPV